MYKCGFSRLIVVWCVSCIVLAASAQATELLINGGFETGNFTGWNAQTEAGSDGTIIVSSADSAPDGGLATVGPASGRFYAVTGQGGPGAYALTQSFTVAPNATSVIVSFDLFANDFAGIIDRGALDYTGEPVEFATADLLTATANAFSTAAGDVVDNFYSGADNTNGGPSPYTAYSFNVTGLVTAGDTYQIRFGEADNQSNFSLGIDNVSVEETVAPEPATFFLLLPALAGLAAWGRRYSSTKELAQNGAGRENGS
jgi:hypothetical protein